MKNWQGKLITFAQEPWIDPFPLDTTTNWWLPAWHPAGQKVIRFTKKTLESFLVLYCYWNPQAGFIRFVVLTTDGQQGCITINQADECIIREITYER